MRDDIAESIRNCLVFANIFLGILAYGAITQIACNFANPPGVTSVRILKDKPHCEACGAEKP